eukprot:gene5092-7100_t
MENLLQSTQSSNIKIRLESVEKIITKLKKVGYISELQNDMKMKLINGCINMLKDGIPKVMLLAFDSLELIITNHRECFYSYANITFDALLAKLSDSKPGGRLRATEVMLLLIDFFGLPHGMDRLQTHFSHKNTLVKEQILHIISNIHERYQDQLVEASPQLCSHMTCFLTDPQTSVRQLATEVLVSLYPSFKERLMTALVTNEVRPTQIKAIQDLIGNNVNNNYDKISNRYDDEDSDAQSTDSPFVDKTKIKSSGLGLSRTSVNSININSKVGNKSRRSLSATTNSTNNRRLSNISTKPTVAIDDIQITSPIKRFGSPIKSSTTVNYAHQSCYSPDYILSILHEGSSLEVPVSVYNEKEIIKLFQNNILNGLSRSDDWQARMNALIMIQYICVESSDIYYDIIIASIKLINEQISSQVLDLRSCVSKEASRTIAVICFQMRNRILPFVEMWFNILSKQIIIKIQVISSAADRTIRVMIACCKDHKPLLNLVIESCNSKNGVVRKLALEYLSLICSIWKIDFIERNITSIKSILKIALSDADNNARKTTRMLYWILYNRPPFSLQDIMNKFLSDLDATIQRNIQTEQQSLPSHYDYQQLSMHMNDPNAIFHENCSHNYRNTVVIGS